MVSKTEKCNDVKTADFILILILTSHSIFSLRDEASPGESLLRLLKGCPNLKKLFLAAIRGLTDRDLENIANLCPNLEQLDLLGVMGISTEKCYL